MTDPQVSPSQQAPPSQQVSDWLSRFGAALDRNNPGSAADLFGDECYWRDLVSFTWNIKTLEGKDQIQGMLAATISDVQPCRWQSAGEADDENGVIVGWFTFETAVARGKGHLRLNDKTNDKTGRSSLIDI